MEEKRKNFQSKLSDDIKYNERMIVTLKKSIESIQASLSGGKDMTFYENRITQTEAAIENYKKKNEDMRAKLALVMSGGCDIEILANQKAVENELKKKKEEVSKKEEVEKKRDEKRKGESKVFDTLERAESRRDYHSKKDIDRAYERYLNIIETAPDYILNNIKTMPNNKGYRFKNVIFYGELPAEKNAPIVIFDRKPNGMLIIETYSDQEVVYFKGRDSHHKELVSRTRLVKNSNSPATRVCID